MISGNQKIFNVILSVLATICIFNMIWMYAEEQDHPRSHEVQYENPMPGNNPGGNSTGPPPIHNKECK